MNDCEHIQELMAWDTALDGEAQAHIATCPRCSATATEWLRLQSELRSQAESAPSDEVPDGFADQVMARLEEDDATSSSTSHWLRQRWVQIALAHLGLATALVNLVRLVFSSLVPTTTLGAP